MNPSVSSLTIAAVLAGGLFAIWWWARQARNARLLTLFTVAGPAACILIAQIAFLPMPGGAYVYGLVLGLLTAMVALGMALIYRANRILNFAQGDLGLVPTVLALDLIAYSGLPYLAGALLGLGAAVILGIVVEFFIIRRFFRSSRLILTVATIGLAQLLTLVSLAIPFLWGKDPISITPNEPFEFTFEVSPITFHASALIALIVAPLCLAAVAVFLRYTSVGMAVRASAERSDRASMLGIPVKRLQTVVWVIATVLSFVAVFLKSGLIGLPFASNGGFGTTSFGALLTALTALTLGRLTNLPSVAVSAVALGMLEQATIWNNSENPALVYPIMAIVVLVGLIVRKTGQSRTEHDTAASWQAAEEVRPIPREVRRVPEVLVAKWGGLAVLVILAYQLPNFGFMESGNMLKASAVVIFAMVGVSIIILTGWAGQVSLGQMAFVGFGGAVGAVVTRQWGLDLSLAMLVAGLAGAAVAVVVGLPALRLRGMFLAVTTLAFAVTASNFLLDPKRFGWIPTKRIDRPALFGRFDLTSQASMYYLCLVVLALMIVAMLGIRRSRTGRALLALRENERGAQAYGINITRAKLTAFALSGFLAAVAGCLFVHVTGQFSQDQFGAGPSFTVFTSTVVGGLGSLTGAVLGALYSRGGTWFLQGNWQLLPSAVGVLLVLLLFPGGLSGLVFRLRDMWLRTVGRRFDIIIPSLLADVRVDEVPLERAEESVEAHEHAAETDPAGGDVADPDMAGGSTGRAPERAGAPVGAPPPHEAPVAVGASSAVASPASPGSPAPPSPAPPPPPTAESAAAPDVQSLLRPGGEAEGSAP